MVANPNIVAMVAPATELVLDFSGYSWGEAKAFTEGGANEDSIEDVALVLSRVVKSIPHDWFVEDAPLTLDLSNPESFDWVQSPKMAKLQRAIAELTYTGKPIFTFERLSYKDEKDLQKLYVLERDTEDTPEKAIRLHRAHEQLLCKTVLSVPNNWLVAAAPENLNWRDRNSYNYLQQPAFKALLHAFNEAKEEAGK